MRERVVVVLGAGNLRCGPPVAASLATWGPDDIVNIRLWDANEERLDLFDRLLRACLDREGTAHNVRASSNFDEELDGATDVIFCVHEDCARRTLGRKQPILFVPAEPTSLVDQVRGDPNKPTSPELLSQLTHEILSTPLDETGNREEAISKAVSALLDSVPERARILSLEREVELPTRREYTAMEWPSAIPERDLPLVPHQVLRWILGEDSLSSLLYDATESPLNQWLEQ